MRIAQCSDTFLPIVDGVGRVVHHYATALALAGHECYVITPLKNTGFRGGQPFEIVDFVSVPVPSAPQYRTGIASLDLHYTERLSLIELDLIHAHAPGLAGVEALRLAEKLDIPVIGTFHSKYYDDFLRVTRSDVLASLGSRFVAEFYQRCDEVWTVSENAARALHAYGYRGRIEIVPNGAEMRTPDPKHEAAARRKYHLGDMPILLYVGQIDLKKNLRRVLESAALLQGRGSAFQLVLAGQGRDRKELERLAASMGLENVTFIGHVGDRDLLDGLYMAASLFVFPSLYDTAGLVVREAAVMGTPSVVVRDTAPAEVICDGVNGFLCQDNAASLSEVIARYLYDLTPSQRAAIRLQVQKTVPLPWEKVMRQVEERYQSLIRRGRLKRKSILDNVPGLRMPR